MPFEKERMLFVTYEESKLLYYYRQVEKERKEVLMNLAAVMTRQEETVSFECEIVDFNDYRKNRIEIK